MCSATSSQGSRLVRMVVSCTNKGGHIDAFLNNAKCHTFWRGLLSRPPNLKRSERQGLFVMPVNSLVVDSMSEQSENVTIAHFLWMSLSSCCWLSSIARVVVYTIIGSKFLLLSSSCTCTPLTYAYVAPTCTCSCIACMCMHKIMYFGNQSEQYIHIRDEVSQFIDQCSLKGNKY